MSIVDAVYPDVHEARVERETDRARIETKRQASYLATVAQACAVAALMSWDATDYRFFGEVTRHYILEHQLPSAAKNLTLSERRLLELGRLSWSLVRTPTDTITANLLASANPRATSMTDNDKPVGSASA